MSSISSSTSFQSPLVRLQSELSSEVKAGTVKSADSDALSAALTSIDSSLSADKATSSGSSRPDPKDVQTKIGSLIDQQVSAGSLTSDQATELKQLFSNAAPTGGAGGDGGPGGVGGPGGAGGPHKAHGHHAPPPPPPSDDSSDTTSTTDSSTDPTTTSSTASSTSTSSTSDSSDLLADFLKQVQSTLAQGYSQSGTTTTSNTSLLFNISA